MNVANIYRKLKQILNDSNAALVEKKLDNVSNLNKISSEIEKLGKINRLPYFLQGDVVGLFEEDLEGLTNISRDYKLSNYKIVSAIIPTSVTSIGLSAFRDCPSLKSITIPNSVTTIGDWAFMNCSSLTSITIPDSVTTIGSRSFVNCTNIRRVSISKNIKSIGDYVFANCDRLEDVYLYSIEPPVIGGILNFSASAILHVPIGGGDAYKSATNWSLLASQIVEDIEAN